MIFVLSHNQLKSQVISSEKTNTINEINDLLRNNPYTDDFQELTFYYSIEITSLNEIIVNLEYDGPFKTIYKARISDLNPITQNNSAMIPSTYLCWRCKSADSKENAPCVQNEIIYTSGDRELHTASEICVMFTNEKNVYKKLYDAFERLFSEFLDP
jgi:hypothetical protein